MSPATATAHHPHHHRMINKAAEAILARQNKRFSLKSLAHLSSITPTNSEQLLQSVVHRLALQHETLSDMLHQCLSSSSPSAKNKSKSSSNSNANANAANAVKKASHKLRTLQYIHTDTHRLGQRLLDNTQIWERFSRPDRHVINSTFLELSARHARTIEHVVDMIELQPQLHDYAEIYLQRRLGIQLLCDHHVNLYKSIRGAVSTQQYLIPVIMDAVAQATHVVDVHLQITPEVKLPSPYQQDATPKISMVQAWINHGLVELLKNAMASSVHQMKQQQGQQASSILPPPVRIELQHCEDDNMLQLDIIDHGTGIVGGQVGIEHAMQLGHTSAKRRFDRLQIQQSYAAVRSPLSSLGVGLPITRYMLEHFGGTLLLFNNPLECGGGCTARMLLPTDDIILERIPGEPINIRTSGIGSHDENTMMDEWPNDASSDTASSSSL